MRKVRNLSVGVLALVLLMLPAAAQAQGFSVEIGSYTIPDLDGSTTATVMVDPAGSDVAAVAVTIGYDATLVEVASCEPAPELASCNYTEPGEVTIQAVDAVGWSEAFGLATIEFEGLGSEATAPLSVTVSESYDVSRAAVVGQGIDGSITVSSRAPGATVELTCADNDGRFDFTFDNPMDDPVNFSAEAAGVEPVAVTVAAGQTDTAEVVGLPDGDVMVTVTADGELTILEAIELVECDPEVAVTVTCPEGVGSVAVLITNRTGGFATYGVKIGSSSRQQRSISNGLRTEVTSSAPIVGDLQVVVDRGNEVIYDEAATVSCGNVEPPTPVPPTPAPATPIPPTPIAPIPTPVPGPDGSSSEVGVASTCLAGNGRIDTNIVNTGDDAAMYRIEFQGLSARQTSVLGGDWWRMPITGRPDGDYQHIVKRDGVVVSDSVVTVSCDTEPPTLATPEVQVVNACRAGNGYILFQFANESDAQKPYIIEFESVQNRSTSAGAFGGAVRAVTGRPNGDYSVFIRSGVSPVMSTTITVNCI